MVELDILANGDVGRSPGIPLGYLPQGPELCDAQASSGDADADHEAIGAPAPDTLPVPLGIDSPPPGPDVDLLPGEPSGSHVRPREDHLEKLPGIPGPLDPLVACRLGFPFPLCHGPSLNDY